MSKEQYDALLRLFASLTARVHALEQRIGVSETSSPGTCDPEDTKSKESAHPTLDPRSLPSIAAPAADLRSTSTDALELKIGGQWLNRLGIIAVLIAASYFLKYAVDNAWVGPATRVLIGLVAGFGVVVWSEHVRRTGHAIFSYSLKAVGIGVLYLSLWASSQMYGLVPYGLAFFAMTAVTAATVALALWQDAQVIAAFAALGAFITPIALSTGENRAVSLFAYISILNLGAVVLLRYRPWVLLTWGAYIGSFVLYASWHGQFYSVSQFPIALVAVSIFFVQFLIAPLVAGRRSDSAEVSLLVLLNAATYFMEVYELINHGGNNRAASVAAVALGCLYILVARNMERRTSFTIVQVHWAIGVALIIVAVPIGFEAQWIAIGWLVEGGALIWVSRRTETEHLKYLGAIALALGIGRLLVVDSFEITRLIFNERMLTFTVAIGTLAFVTRILMSSVKEEERRAIPILVVAINVLALLALNQEITDAWRRQVNYSDPAGAKTLAIIRDFAHSALWMTYGAGLMFVGFRWLSRFLRWQALILIAITIGKVFLYDTSSLDRGYRILSLLALGLVLLATSFFYQRDWFKLNED